MAYGGLHILRVISRGLSIEIYSGDLSVALEKFEARRTFYDLLGWGMKITGPHNSTLKTTEKDIDHDFT